MTKVAVIGGGPAGLATAWHLIHSDPTAEITVYQQGWRLGGKGAASRGRAGRIEEHGIHLFGNFYANALGMMEQAYAERGLEFDDEFLPNNLHLSLHHASGRRFSLRIAAVTSPSEALQEDNINPRLLLGKLFESVIEAAVGMTEIPPSGPTGLQALKAQIRRRLSQSITKNAVNRRTAKFEKSIASKNISPETDGPLYIEAIRNVMLLRFAVPIARWLRRTPRGMIRYTTIDLLFAVLRGTLVDDVFNRGVDSIDGEDHLAWLRRHGASEQTLGSPVARAVANICFQYPDANASSDPGMSAAAFLNFLLRQLAAPGPNFWYFRHGTGESVVLPLYDALRHPPKSAARNPVLFEFFTRVTDLVPSADGSRIDRIRLRRHARPAAEEYDPIVETGSGRHWPASPVLDQLRSEDQGAIAALQDLEDWYELLGAEPGRDEELRRGTDFDVVVLATPPPTHPFTCPSLLNDAGWRQMKEGLPFIPTQGIQLWIADEGERIGLPAAPYRGNRERWSTAECDAPNSCWVDFSDLLEVEDWPSPRPGSLHYFCGPLDVGPDGLPDPADGNADYSATAKRLMTTQTIGMLNEIGGLLPGVVGSSSFRYDRLVDPDGRETPDGPARLSTQHLHPNVVPTELYGVSAPNHVAHRRSPWESGYDNLVLAGDWVYTGFNINSFEGATISGALASYTICGSPDPRDIVGYDFLRPQGGPRKPDAD